MIGALGTPDSGLAVMGLGVLDHSTNVLSGRLVLGLSLAGTLTQANRLSGRLVLGLSLDGTLKLEHSLAGRLVLGLRLRDGYTGPGTGLVLSGVTKEQLLATLREGDSFRTTLPWAGIQGRTGLARDLSRTIDNQQRLTFVILFIPNTDPSIMQSQADSGRPRYVVPVRDNLARRVTDTEKTVNKLQSDS
jgi:hypothetical protein